MVEMTNEALIKWLHGKPADGEYEWTDPVNCLLGNYLADNQSCWGTVQYSDMPNYNEIAQQKPWTFGAALERAEALKALPPPPLQLAPPAARELATVDAE